LLRSINRAVGCSQEIEILPWGEERYIYLRDSNKKFPDNYISGKPLILYDDLLQMLTERMPLKYRLSIIIPELLLAIESEAHCAPVLPRSTLHHGLRQILELCNYNQRKNDADDIFSQSLISESNGEVLQLLMKELASQIQHSYSHKPFFNEQISEYYLKLANQYFSDLLEDGFTEKLPQYWKNIALRDLKYEDHKNRLEYLIHLGKEKLKKFAPVFYQKD